MAATARGLPQANPEGVTATGFWMSRHAPRLRSNQVFASFQSCTCVAAYGGCPKQGPETVSNSGGTIEALDGSTVQLAGTVNGGTLTTTGSGTIQSQNGTLDGTVNVPTNAGTLDVNGYSSSCKVRSTMPEQWKYPGTVV
jgi:hypothetical protein